MRNFRSNKTTARDLQRSLFIGSLADQLGKMASFKGDIEEEMQGYIDEGMSPSEAEELLLAEGHDLDLVKSCSSRFTPSDDIGPVCKWGYRLSNSNGRIISHIEMDSVIEATSEKDAKQQLEQIILDSGSDASFREIVDIFKLD